jgi:hypothetical protein
MALGQRIAALHKRHEWLDQVLLKEMGNPHPDDIRVAQIKKSKLRVKDEIAALCSVQEKINYAFEEDMEYHRKVAYH